MFSYHAVLQVFGYLKCYISINYFYYYYYYYYYYYNYYHYYFSSFRAFQWFRFARFVSAFQVLVQALLVNALFYGIHTVISTHTLAGKTIYIASNVHLVKLGNVKEGKVTIRVLL